MIELDDFNITFTKGNIEFLKFVLRKFEGKLPYAVPDYNKKLKEGRNDTISRKAIGLLDWARQNNYTASSVHVWVYKGIVHPRAWNMIHKDLCILRQLDKTIPTIQELFAEFKGLTK